MEKGGADPDRCSQSSSSPSPRSRCLAPFLTKTYDLIEGSGANHIVSWNDEGSGFIVWSPVEFSQFLLPRYFKHCNFSSFIRQLNTYGFKKSASNRWEFQHDKFRKGERHLLGEITRRKCLPSVYPSFLKACERRPEAEAIDIDSLVEENKNLQKENSELQLQIAHFKALEVELLDWLSHYMGGTSSNHQGQRVCRSL